MKKRISILAAVICFVIVLAAGISKTASRRTPAGTEMLSNGNLSSWSRGTDTAADQWSFGGEGQGSVSRESSILHLGESYSARITNISGKFSALYQDITDFGKCRGREFVFGAWVNSNNPNSVRLVVYDSGVSSPYHKGSGRWEYLEVRGRIPENPAMVRAHVFIENKATASVYRPSFKVYEGR